MFKLKGRLPSLAALFSILVGLGLVTTSFASLSDQAEIGFVPPARPLAQTADGVSINPANPAVQNGETLNLTLDINPSVLGEVWGYEAICTYNTALFRNPQIMLGDLFKSDVAIQSVNNEQLVVAIAQEGTGAAITQSGTVATLSFTVNSTEATTTTIECEVDVLDRYRTKLVSDQLIQTDITILGETSVEGYVDVFGSVFLGENVPSKYVKITIRQNNGTYLQSQTLPDNATYYIFTDVPFGNYDIFWDAPGYIEYSAYFSIEDGDNFELLPDVTLIPGDVAGQTRSEEGDEQLSLIGDGKVDITDITAIGLNYLSPVTTDTLRELDIDRSGLVELNDLVLVGVGYRKVEEETPKSDPSEGDGTFNEVNLDENYRQTLVLYATVERVDGKSRNIYINPDALAAFRSNQPFRPGTQIVIETFGANPNGADFERDGNGRLIQSNFETEVHISQLSSTGWIFAARDIASDSVRDSSACRSCHEIPNDPDLLFTRTHLQDFANTGQVHFEACPIPGRSPCP